jgi:hypothetical protein
MVLKSKDGITNFEANEIKEPRILSFNEIADGHGSIVNGML